MAMRRAGRNPTDVEVSDIINKIDDGSGHLNFEVKQSVDLSITTIKFLLITTSLVSHIPC